MKVDEFAQRLKSFQDNLYELYKNASGCVREDDWVIAAYKELGVASEEIQVAMEEMTIQTEELALSQLQLEIERQHYKNLFEFLPDAHIVTNIQGKIVQANPAASNLLNVELRFLTGKPLDLFFTRQERRTFPVRLSQLIRDKQVQKWMLQLQPRQRESLEVLATIAPGCDREGTPIALHWSLQDLAQTKQALKLEQHNDVDFSQSHSQSVYHRGELIPLDPKRLWIVRQGWVKLGTIDESGEQILVGLVGKSMPFGSSLTCLPTYQATALSEKVQLTAISWNEIENSPQLKETIFPQLVERLKQTELLLAIAGRRQIQERLEYLLMWLQENFGENVSEGKRLILRLTHQELADICGTTRVTISRLLGKFKEQRRIAYDRDRHIVFIA